jgi:DNA-binding transcriptional ArsR family regulator
LSPAGHEYDSEESTAGARIRGSMMDQKTRAYYEAKSRIFKALAHPTRLLIVDELAVGERCVLDLTEMVGADMSTVSKHLSILKGAGIITDEKRGTQVFYTLKIPCVLNFFACVRDVQESLIEETRDALSARS